MLLARETVTVTTTVSKFVDVDVLPSGEVEIDTENAHATKHHGVELAKSEHAETPPAEAPARPVRHLSNVKSDIA